MKQEQRRVLPGQSVIGLFVVVVVTTKCLLPEALRFFFHLRFLSHLPSLPSSPSPCAYSCETWDGGKLVFPNGTNPLRGSPSFFRRCRRFFCIKHSTLLLSFLRPRLQQTWM